MNTSRRATTSILFAVVAATVNAQGPAIDGLGPVVATSSVKLSGVSQLVELSDGRVMIADAGTRTLRLFDASLANPRVVLDSVTGLPNTFTSGLAGGSSGRSGGSSGSDAFSFSVGGGGGGGGGRGPTGFTSLIGADPSYLIRYRGDTTMWYDNASESFVVIHPDATIGRTMAAPPLLSLTNRRPPIPAASPTLGLVYRISAPIGLARPAALRRVEGQSDTTVVTEDSLVIVRYGFETRTPDTVARLASGATTKSTYGVQTASSRSGTVLYPFADDVATTSDGSIAILHAREYRLDWVLPDGTRPAGQKLTHAWRRITDDMRQTIVDSINGARTRVRDSLLAVRAADSARLGRVPTRPTTYNIDGVTSTREQPVPIPPMPIRVDLVEIPDYYPPVPVRALLADADGNVWIKRIVTPAEPGFVTYDVVNRTQGVIDRVRMPITRTIAGFGKGGIIYLVARDAGVVTVEKVRVR